MVPSTLEKKNFNSFIEVFSVKSCDTQKEAKQNIKIKIKLLF